MTTAIPEAIVAGHICLDIIPAFPAHAQNWYVPGTLLKVGPATVATGGAVSNTGIALHRLGIVTRLMGKVGDDFIGQSILDFIRRQGADLANNMIVAPGEQSSYAVVLNPPGVDRMFLHFTGTNDTFRAADVDARQLDGAKLFHFGYPTLMRAIYADEGRGLAEIFRAARQRGLITTLDMSQPDPQSEAGRVNWPAFLQRVLPVTDVYLPSFDETLLMIDRQRFGAKPDAALLAATAQQLLDWGAKIVALKLGDQGLYARTATRELLAPCFQVDVVGTTGSGDCTIAGFLAGIIKQLPLEQMLTAAVAVGACCCEAPDATGGVQSWDATQQRIAAGWSRRPITMDLPGWRFDAARQLWKGPHDHAES